MTLSAMDSLTATSGEQLEIDFGGTVPPRPEEITRSWRAGLMFSIALLLLLLFGFGLPHGGVSNSFSLLILEQLWLPMLVLLCWLLIVVESLIGVLQAPDKPAAPLKRLLLITLAPITRLAVATAVPNRYVWLPRIGWLTVGRAEQDRLEQRFMVPMLLITLLILPVVGAELFFARQVASSPALGFTVHVTTSLIWVAFTFEFVVQIAVAEKKIDYCKKHWINIVIILLPVITLISSLLSSLALFRFLRVAKAGKLLRAYRLRGVFARALRLALMLNLIERVMQRNLDGYIAGLEEKIGEKELELDELRSKLYDARVKQRLRSHR